MPTASYVVGLGSNRVHGRYGRPEAVVRAAMDAMAAYGLRIIASSRIQPTRAMGPSDRMFANAAVHVESPLTPPALLAVLKEIERDFGRRGARRWGARVLDCDILAWSGGSYRARTLVIPHSALPLRRFAIGPAAEVAPDWRHPRLHLTLRHMAHRLRKVRPVDRKPSTP